MKLNKNRLIFILMAIVPTLVNAESTNSEKSNIANLSQTIQTALLFEYIKAAGDYEGQLAMLKEVNSCLLENSACSKQAEYVLKNDPLLYGNNDAGIPNHIVHLSASEQSYNSQVKSLFAIIKIKKEALLQQSLTKSY